MKIEVVITVWDDGLFKLRDKIEANSIEGISVSFDMKLTEIEDKLIKPTGYDDDDIPF